MLGTFSTAGKSDCERRVGIFLPLEFYSNTASKRTNKRDATHVVHVAVNASFLSLLLLLILLLLLVFLGHDVIQVTEIVLREQVIHGLSHRDQRENLENQQREISDACKRTITGCVNPVKPDI